MKDKHPRITAKRAGFQHIRIGTAADIQQAERTAQAEPLPSAAAQIYDDMRIALGHLYHSSDGRALREVIEQVQGRADYLTLIGQVQVAVQAGDVAQTRKHAEAAYRLVQRLMRKGER